MPVFHTPVLLDETLELLAPVPGGTYLDGTVGGAGHAAAVCERIGRDGTLIGLDRDAEAIEQARQELARCPGRVVLVQANFRDLKSVLDKESIGRLDGVVLDLGVSSHQLDTARGFAFSRDEELDMRMGRDEDIPTAADIVNSYTEKDLADLIFLYGEDRNARRIAKAIVRARQAKPIRTTGELADIVVAAVGKWRTPAQIHAGTLTFQAIRMAVNEELESAAEGIEAAVDTLRVGGRICVISFHGGEHRVVKEAFRRLSGRCVCDPRQPECRCGARPVLRVLTKKAVAPGSREIAENPRSRSARLRCAEKIEEPPSGRRDRS